MTIQLMIEKGTAAARAEALSVDQYELVAIDPTRSEDNAKLAERYELMRFARGEVVAERERNMHDDSDFYATYRTAGGGFAEIQVGTTRGWSYLNWSTRDADAAVQVEYAAFQERCRELGRAMQEKEDAARREREAPELGITPEGLARLERSFRGNLDILRNVQALLRTKKFRSAFRASLAERVRAWCAEEAPQYDSPLSQRQIQYL